MTPTLHERYRLPLPHDGVWREILNSDSAVYGGSDQGNLGAVRASAGAAHLVLPPLATLMLEWDV
jgi:1,4-alpha-glucan branching enzyme